MKRKLSKIFEQKISRKCENTKGATIAQKN